MFPWAHDRLTLAGVHYERRVSAGDKRADAFKSALGMLRASSVGTMSDATWKQGLAMVAAIVPRHPVCVMQGQRFTREVLSGQSRGPLYCTVRAEVAWVMSELHYHPKVIGAAMMRDRSSVIYMIKKVNLRLKGDHRLRGRLMRLVESVQPAQAAA